MMQPDEGLIHAWLDGELPPDEAARVEQLVANDAVWAAAAAEARGLIAASARILSALDDVPAQVMPDRRPATAAKPRGLPWWTRAAAAVIVVAGGSVLVLQRSEAPSLPAPQVADTARAPAASSPVPAEAKQEATTPSTPVVSPSARARTATADAASSEKSQPTTAPAVAPPPAGAPATVAPSAVAPSAVAEKLAAPIAQATVPTAAPVREAVPMMRTAGGAPVPRAELANAPAQPLALRDQEARRAKAASDVSVMGGVVAAPAMPVCFVVRDAATPAGDSVVMHQVRLAGDTVFLALRTAEPAVTAWVLRGAGPRPGLRSPMIAIIATPTSCPKP